MRVLLIANPNSTGQSDNLFRRVIPLLRAVDGVRLTGIDAGPVRPPLADPSPEDVAELEALIEHGRGLLES